MKKIFMLLLAFAAILWTSCSSTGQHEVPADPGEAAVYYFDLAREADLDGFIDGFYFGEEISGPMLSFAKQMVKQSLLKGEEGENTKAQLAALKVRLVDSHMHGEEAHVTLELDHPDEEARQAEFDMKKIDGVWKIVITL